MPDDDQPGNESQAHAPHIDPAKIRNWILLVILCTGVLWSLIEFGLSWWFRPASARLEAVEAYIEAEGDLPQQFQDFQMEQQRAWQELGLEMELKDSATLIRRERHDDNVVQLKAMICHIEPSAPGCGGGDG